MVNIAQKTTKKIKQLLPINHQLWLKFDLLRVLVRRNLEAKYKGSILGNLWPIVNQLLQLLIYTYVFSIILQVKLDLPGGGENSRIGFGIWLFAGLLPWLAFTNGLTQSATAVIEQANLVKKVVFPLALLPLVPVLSTFIESALGLAILIVFVAIFSHTLHITLALLPLVWLSQLLLTSGLAYLISSLSVFLRDIPQTIGVILNLWFYITPIVYPSKIIPPEFKDLIFWINPLATFAEVYRDLVIIGKVNYWSEWLAVTILSLVLFSLGLFVYRRLRPAFADVL